MANAASALKGILNDTIGPMGVLTAGALAFVKYTAGAALNAEKMAAALRASGQAKGLENQFKVIMGSADAARKKVAELSKEAQRSPFSFQALGKAALNLQVLSNGAFASARALRQVQDVAVATGAPVDAVASAMGDLVGSMKRGGDGAGAAAAQLAAMGAISQAAAQKVADLAAQGAPVGEAMRVVESETSKASGAAAELASTIDGLQAQLENLQTASDVKIGGMFEEGAKAGARAAIGFQKFNNAFRETAAGPWAAIMGGLNMVKEAIGSFLGSLADTGAARAFFDILGQLSVAVLIPMAAGLASVAKMLGGFAMAALRATGAIKGLVAVGGAFGRLMTVGSAATLAAATALVYLATKAYEAQAAIKALEAAEKDRMQNNAGRESNIVRAASGMQTEDDRQATLQQIGGSIQDAQQELNEAQSAQAAARAKQKSLSEGTFLGVSTSSRWERMQADEEVVMADRRAGFAQGQVDMLRARRAAVEAQGGLGVDRAQDQQARERMSLEKQIRDEAFASAQAAADPQMQARMANAERRRSQERLKTAEAASRVNPKERADLDQATSALVPGEADPENLRQGIEQIKAVKATTESSRLSRDIAVRTALVQQRSELDAAQAGRTTEQERAMTPQQREAEAARRQVLREQIAAIGGESEISGARIQELQRRRDFAAAQEDPNAARQADESARNQAQAAKEAEAAQKALNAAKEKTLALENQLAGISGSGAQADEAATIESENRTAALQKALTAAKALAAAQEQYAQARESGSTEAQDQARAGVEQASVAAAAAGVGDRGVQEIQSALEQQILQANLNQAKITQAAAQARVEAAQRQLNTEKMLAQMAQKSAEANVNNTNPEQAIRDPRTGQIVKSLTRSQIESDAADAEIAALERKMAAATEKDAAEKAMVEEMKGGRTASPETARRVKAANEAAELAGVGDQLPQDIQKQLGNARYNKAQQEADRIAAAQTEGERIKLASLRAQEQYGPNKDQARRDADALEDSMAKEARTKELGDTIKDPEIAAGLASAEVEMARAMSNIERTGQPEMGEMASVGGSAGFGGLVNDNSKDLKAIKENAEKIKTLMDTFKTQQETALADNKRVIAMAEAEMSQ